MADHPERGKGHQGHEGMGFRFRVFLDLLSMLVVVFLVLFLLAFLLSGWVVRNLAIFHISEGQRQTRVAMDEVFAPIPGLLGVIERYRVEGLLKPRNTDAMNKLLWPILEEFPVISSINTGDAKGDGFMLLRVKDGWLNRVVRKGKWGDRAFWEEWSLDHDFQREYWREVEYDPRTRPWFRGAASLGPGEIFWTEPYLFFTTGKPGMSASIHVNPGEKGQIIVACDVQLSGLREALERIGVSPEVQLAIVSEDGRLVASSGPEGGNPMSKKWLREVSALRNPLVGAALTVWMKGEQVPRNSFEISIDDRRWWGAIEPERGKKNLECGGMRHLACPKRTICFPL